MYRFYPAITAILIALAANTALLSNADEHAPQESEAITKVAVATFAGGCFWCLEADYDKVKGVLKTTSGFAGGNIDNPTYKQVASGQTRHIEAVQVEYDPAQISYQELLDIFWVKVDPTDDGGQFCDRGMQYRTAIFPIDEQQQAIATAAKKSLDESDKLPDPVVTEIIANSTFYPAEKYHQNYHNKNPIRYKVYRYRCGRDQRLNELWNQQRSSM